MRRPRIILFARGKIGDTRRVLSVVPPTHRDHATPKADLIPTQTGTRPDPTWLRPVRGSRLPCLAVLALSLALALPGAASAAITPSRDGTVVAQAVGDQLPAGVLTSGAFSLIPPGPSLTTECSNGIDDDGDGKIDFAGATPDPGCQSAGDNRELDDTAPQCSNGIDDDADGAVDFVAPAGATADPGCSSAQDDQEVDGAINPTPQCSNGFDDDGDGKIDWVRLV